MDMDIYKERHASIKFISAHGQQYMYCQKPFPEPKKFTLAIVRM